MSNYYSAAVPAGFNGYPDQYRNIGSPIQPPSAQLSNVPGQAPFPPAPGFGMNMSYGYGGQGQMPPNMGYMPQQEQGNNSRRGRR